VRPRAYLELARLRLDESLAAPAGADGKLSPAQVAAILDPLYTARAQPPPMPEVYALIAKVWRHSASPPKPEHLNILLEGTLFFPKDTDLISQAAGLMIQSGDHQMAQKLINLGITVSPDTATRARFESLQAQLPPAPAPAAGRN